METPRYRKPGFPRIPKEGLKGRLGYDYIADPKLVAAANAAFTLQMPLLLTGDAGCGKTDFAWAAAGALAVDAQAGPSTGDLLECYVRSDSRARDLLYHYDAIRRFGDAQHGGEAGRRRAEDPRPYITLQPLGEALMSAELRVVLIDEIDKAPRDLPNDLLRELDQGHFEIPEIPDEAGTDAGPVDGRNAKTFRRTMRRPNPDRRPLVIITSNVERQLPDPFLRRCVFFHIPFPDSQMRAILSARFPESAQAPLFIDKTLEIFSELRQVKTLTRKPTTSELINWVDALHQLFEPADVVAALERFKGMGTGTLSAPFGLPWHELPALGCLVKLREDLERLEAAG